MNTSTVFFIIIAVLTVETILIVYLVLRGKREKSSELSELLNRLRIDVLEYQTKALETQENLLSKTSELLDKRLKMIIDSVNENLSKTQGNINEQLSSTSKLIVDVNKKLGELNEEMRRVEKIGEEISSLNDILNAPKLRGGFGEYMLEILLADTLPQKYYELQYKFNDGVMVDAIVKLGDFIVPIDSKFPMEAYKRYSEEQDETLRAKYKKDFIKSVLGRVKEVSQKYIKPESGTLSFSLMYIPSETIYYEIITEREGILEECIKRKVFPVSPLSLYTYLFTIVMGLKGLEIERKAKEILKKINELSFEFGKFEEEFSVLGTHIKNAFTKYDDLTKREFLIKNKIENLK